MYSLIISIITLLLPIGILKFVADTFFSTPIEAHLESNTQLLIRHLIKIFIGFLISVLLIIISIYIYMGNERQIQYFENQTIINGKVSSTTEKVVVEIKANNKTISYSENNNFKKGYVLTLNDKNKFSSKWNNKILPFKATYKFIAISKDGKQNGILEGQNPTKPNRLRIMENRENMILGTVLGYIIFVILYLYFMLWNNWEENYRRKLLVDLELENYNDKEYVIMKRIGKTKVLLLSQSNSQNYFIVDEKTVENKRMRLEGSKEVRERRLIKNYYLWNWTGLFERKSKISKVFFVGVMSIITFLVAICMFFSIKNAFELHWVLGIIYILILIFIISGLIRKYNTGKKMAILELLKKSKDNGKSEKEQWKFINANKTISLFENDKKIVDFKLKEYNKIEKEFATQIGKKQRKLINFISEFLREHTHLIHQ